MFILKIEGKNILLFETPAKFYDWLAENHNSETEVWAKIFKKNSGIKSISWDEAVVEAACWGWINGLRKKYDDQSYAQKFTPRNKKSPWTRRNRALAEELVASGRMQKSGLKEIKFAEADGRWKNAYERSEPVKP